MDVKRFSLAAAIATLLIFALVAGACKSAATPTTTTTISAPGGGALVNSDSNVTARIQSISYQSSGYPWKLDVLIQSTQDVGTLVNTVKDSVGKVVTVFSDQAMTSFKVGDVVTARIIYSGDVNIPGGVRLYLYDVVPA